MPVALMSKTDSWLDIGKLNTVSDDREFFRNVHEEARSEFWGKVISLIKKIIYVGSETKYLELGKKEKKIIDLYFDRINLTEIGKVLGSSSNTAQVQMGYIRNKLRFKLAHDQRFIDLIKEAPTKALQSFLVGWVKKTKKEFRRECPVCGKEFPALVSFSNHLVRNRINREADHCSFLTRQEALIDRKLVSFDPKIARKLVSNPGFYLSISWIRTYLTKKRKS